MKAIGDQLRQHSDQRPLLESINRLSNVVQGRTVLLQVPVPDGASRPNCFTILGFYLDFFLKNNSMIIFQTA